MFSRLGTSGHARILTMDESCGNHSLGSPVFCCWHGTAI